jgi:hypothetical protein
MSHHSFLLFSQTAKSALLLFGIYFMALDVAEPETPCMHGFVSQVLQAQPWFVGLTTSDR